MNTLGKVFTILFNVALLIIVGVGYGIFYVVKWILSTIFRLLVIALIASIVYYLIKEENLIEIIWTYLSSYL